MSSLTTLATYAPNPAPVRAQSTKLSAKGTRVVYPQGRCVVIRDLDHTHPVTVARISPSGYYCASADAAGNVRVWDLVGEDQSLKLHTQALGGRIHDLSWDGESQRIIAVGEGREALGKAFLVDTGASTGEISGHSKPINAVAVRAQRPFRAVTVGDDTNVTFFTGVPYRYARTLTEHTRFVHDAAYLPDGSLFCTAGADGRIFVYSGTSGDVQGELKDGEGAHDGSVYAVSASPDSKSIVSAGADGRIKVWSVESRAVVASWHAPGDRVAAQQMGVVWADGRIVSVSGTGELNVFAAAGAAASLEFLHTLRGSTRGISSLVAFGGKPVGGSLDGSVYTWGDECTAVRLDGPNGPPGVVALAAGSVLTAAALDDKLHSVDGGDEVQLSGQPRGVAHGAGATYVISEKGLDVISGTSTSSIPADKLGFEATAVAASADVVAVGGADCIVRLCTSDGNPIPNATLEGARSAVTALAFSPDGTLLAAGESSGKIRVYDVASREVRLTQWVFHSARINAIAWAPDGKHAASASLDTHVFVWSVERPLKHVSVKNAHAGGATGIAWLSDSVLASSGSDGVVRTYTWQHATT
ncbi:WD40 repeat-like protein [Malassezia cuniculi]|uniref:WD40 repeat-like protein n=1 Tax=Malassezia cuniculi TaxID=948313 RepID=A0AAF0J7R4_9BASI|nr:WD40 repeat-like protein [Malassezia cuniculi]